MIWTCSHLTYVLWNLKYKRMLYSGIYLHYMCYVIVLSIDHLAVATSSLAIYVIISVAYILLLSNNNVRYRNLTYLRAFLGLPQLRNGVRASGCFICVRHFFPNIIIILILILYSIHNTRSLNNIQLSNTMGIK